MNRIISHANYSSTSLTDDIAILVLTSNLELSNKIKVVDLPAANVEVPITANVVSFGYDGPDFAGVYTKVAKYIQWINETLTGL